VIFVTAAEVSGDMHAAGLIEALRRRLGQAEFIGVGGPRMASAGCTLLEEPVRRAAMLGGAFTSILYFWRLIRHVKAEMALQRPALHVPVDSPAMNWHLCKAARRAGVPVMYYVAPQVWAWAPWRAKKLARLTDAVACILPFEQPYLRQRGVAATFVGHPLLDRLAPANPPDLAEPAATAAWRIALLPGSRDAELRGHVAAMACLAGRLKRRYPRAQFTFASVDAESARKIRDLAGEGDFAILGGQTGAVLAGSHFAVVASGTATLEAAHFGVPMVIVHRANLLLYRLIKPLICTKYLSLVNILAGYELAPELMPWGGSVDGLEAAAVRLLADLPALRQQRAKLLELAAPLKAQGCSAADNAAELAMGLLAPQASRTACL
jgi:lipid-A-disaccharide synthase